MHIKIKKGQKIMSTPPDSRIDHDASIQYWASIEADVNGMLGGFPQVSQIDLRGSASFLAKVRRLMRPPAAAAGSAAAADDSSDSTPARKTPLKRAVDCGAGIGRVTAGFLSRVSEVVDVVEPVEKFAQVVRDSPLKQQGKIDDIYVVGLEAWQPNSTSKKYDLMWNQWCLGHLTDQQLVDYLVRCRDALSEQGVIVVKENLSTDPQGADLFDELDSSVTRTDAKFRSLFAAAGLRLIRSEDQLGFPPRLGLLPVRSYALRPV